MEQLKSSLLKLFEFPRKTAWELPHLYTFQWSSIIICLYIICSLDNGCKQIHVSCPAMSSPFKDRIVCGEAGMILTIFYPSQL